MSLSECSHCHYKNASSEVYCRQCQRPMHQATGRAGETVVTSHFPRHPPEKRVKIWFDDEGEPHETLVDPEPEIPEPAAVGSVAIGQRQVQVWFDEEGEPHEGPMGGAPAPTRVEPRPKPVWYDDNGMPHATREAAAAANTRPDTDRTTVSPPPQTHSAFTQGLTPKPPKPIYFERVETARDEPLPRQLNGQTVLRPSVQTPTARATEQPARTQAPVTPRSTSAVPHNLVQARTPGQVPTTPRQGPGAHTPSARSTAGNLGTPVPQRSPTASPATRTAQPAAQASAQGATGRSSSTLGPAAVRAQQGPPRSSSSLGATPTVRTPAAPTAEPAAEALFSDNIITDEHTVATADMRSEGPGERTVATPAPAQAREAQTTSSSSPPQRTVAPSSSLASNYRAAAAHAALVDGAAAQRPARAETPERRPAAQAPLIGIDLPAGSGAHTGAGPSRAVSTHTPFALLTDERTVATTQPPTPAVLASTLAPVAGRATIAPQGPAAQRPTLTHTPVPMEDRSNPLATRPAGGGFFNRGAEAPNPVVPPGVSSFSRPEVPLTAPTPAAGGGFFHRADPTAVSRPAEPPAPAPAPARRITGITDPKDASPAPAPPAPPVLANSLEARLTTNRDAVHDQATVVRDSPFLQSEPTVVRGPGVSDEESEPPTRRRLTEPLLARSTGFVAPTEQAVQTERASLWRLAAAALIDGLLTIGVGLSTAAAEMLLFGGHWPTETTNPLDAFAMWMHNYPGTQKRALLVMLLFAWGYAALGARQGRTLGRTLLRLIALQQDGDMMTWPRAAWRSLVGLFSVLFFGAGYFWAIVDSQHRALHDVLSRSIVVSRKSS